MSARRRASLGAQVTSRTPLLYGAGANASLDRPGHVRAGSALAMLPDGRLAVVQDDAAFLAVVDPSGAIASVPFPVGPVRQFDDLRGNKAEKLDLEAAFVTPGGALVALGSGSSPLRECVVWIDEPASLRARVTVVHAAELYAALRTERAFAGSELNVEGAVVAGADLLLFQRGNGAPRIVDGHRVAPVDATGRLALGALLAFLRGDGPPPTLRSVRAWDLGMAGGSRLTFTDSALHPSGAVAFLACAEDSPDATRDGPVSAVMLGRLDDASDACELGPIVDEHGEPLLDKTEGLAFDPTDRARAFVVTDRDDPLAPSDLLVLRLGDAWLA